jgi:hypothetical protein
MKLFMTIFGGIGLAMLAITVHLIIQKNKFVHSSVVSKGRVIELGRHRGSKRGNTYYPIVEFYTQDGQKQLMHSSISSDPPAYKVNEEVEVYYQPDNPAHAEIKGFFSQWLPALITGFIGTIFGGIGGGLFLAKIRRKRNVEHLQLFGRRVKASIVSVDYKTNLRVNGRSPYVIRCQWLNPRTNELHIFTSDNLWFDPKEYITGTSIDVLIDEQNPKKYYVDTQFLPKVAQ